MICQKAFLEQYFIDHDPLGDGIPMEHPYITFNKLFGVHSLNEYSEKYGVHIYYGYGFSWDELPNGQYEIKFCTRWEYPIRAIIRALNLDHGVEWFAVEENHIYVSKFYWSNGVKEDILFIEDDFYHWLDENIEFDDSLKDPDEGVWYFLQCAAGTWQHWESNDDFSRYLDTAAVDVELPVMKKA